MQFQSNRNYHIEYTPVDILHDLSISADSGNLHVLRDDTIVSLHTHNCLEIGYCYEGAGIFIIDNQVLSFTAGDLCMIFKNQMHKAQSEQGKTSSWKFLYIDIDILLSKINGNQTLAKIFLHRPKNISILSSKAFPDISFMVQEIITEITEQANNYKDIITSLLTALILKVARLVELHETEAIEWGSISLKRIIPALNYISQNYMEIIYIKTLSDLCNDSCSNFRRHFGKLMHQSPLDYVVKVRIQMASILLKNSDYSVLEISGKTGFNSLSSFNRHFKKIQGLSPRAFRGDNPVQTIKTNSAMIPETRQT